MKGILDMIQANKELQSVASEVGITMRDLMYDQARLLAQDAIKKSPPGNMNIGTAAQKKIGVDSVRSDLKKMFWPTDYDQPMESWNDRLDQMGYEIYTITKRGKQKLKKKQILNDASAQELRQIHLTYRNNKGKVKFPFDREKVAAGKYAVPRRVFNKYLKDEIKKVGQLKAGFIPAAQYFSGLAKTSAKGIPSWVMKQTNKIGSQQNSINVKTGLGFAYIINNVSYADFAISHGLQKSLEMTRQYDILRQAKKRIKKLEKEHNNKFARAE